MSLFEYKAVTPNGETLSGRMEATSEAEVVARLQDAGNMPIFAKAASSGALSISGIKAFMNRISRRDIGLFTEQLATLLRSGLPLDRALFLLHDLAESPALKRMVGDVRDQVRGGKPLSEALESQHGVFDRLYINMVRAGEVGGALEIALTRLSEYMARSKALKDTVISAMVYPMILLLLAVGSLLVLLMYVVPQFMPVFEDAGAELPLLTQIVLGTGEVLKSFWWLIAILLVAAVVWFRQQLAGGESRYRWHQRFIQTKWVGDLIGKIEIARFTRTFGTLLDSGVPVMSGMTIARKVMGNAVLAEIVDEAAEEVKTGGSLAQTLGHKGRFPKLALQMIAVGEETGQLDEMLLRVADTYDIEVRNTIDRMMSILSPALTLGIAAVIAIIVISILMAIMSINNLV